MRLCHSVFVASVLCSMLGVSFHAFATNSTFYPIDVPGSTSTAANGINNREQIVGSFTDATGRHGFLDTNGTFTTIDGPIGPTAASGINDSGHIVGQYGDSQLSHGFEYFKGILRTIDPPGGTRTIASGINDSGNIVGTYSTSPGCTEAPSLCIRHGFLLNGNTFRTIDAPGATFTFANGIDNRGDIVGNYITTPGFGSSHGFLLTNGGTFTTIDFPGAFETIPRDINNFGTIVGQYNDLNTDGSAGALHGFLWEHGQFMTIDFPGTTSGTSIQGINDRGDFVGNSPFGAFLDPPGDATVATPEPSTLLLMGPAVIALGLWRRKMGKRISN